MNEGRFDFLDRALSAHGDRLERAGDIVLNLDYWDCDCRHNYIHPISRGKCGVCGFLQEESPSSRQGEVLRYVHGEKN